MGVVLDLKDVGLDETINHKCAEFDELVSDTDDELTLVGCIRLRLWEQLSLAVCKISNIEGSEEGKQRVCSYVNDFVRGMII